MAEHCGGRCGRSDPTIRFCLLEMLVEWLRVQWGERKERQHFSPTLQRDWWWRTRCSSISRMTSGFSYAFFYTSFYFFMLSFYIHTQQLRFHYKCVQVSSYILHNFSIAEFQSKRTKIKLLKQVNTFHVWVSWSIATLTSVKMWTTLPRASNYTEWRTEWFCSLSSFLP